MAQSSEVLVWRRICEVRRLQRRGAEATASKSAAELRIVEARQAEQSDLLAAHALRWRACVDGAALDVTMMRLWGAEFARAKDELRTLQDAVTRARATLDEAHDALRVALAQVDTAESMAARVAKQQAGRVERNALAALEDRVAHRRRSA